MSAYLAAGAYPAISTTPTATSLISSLSATVTNPLAPSDASSPIRCASVPRCPPTVGPEGWGWALAKAPKRIKPWQPRG